MTFAFIVPALSIYKILGSINPRSYQTYEESPESAHAEAIASKVTSILEEEQKGERYSHTIKELMEDLPEGVEKNVQGFIAHRLRVVNRENAMHPIHATGIPIDSGSYIGRFYIAVQDRANVLQEQALPWIAAHEFCHLLEGDNIETQVYKCLASFTAVALCVYYCSFSTLPAAASGILANVCTHIYRSHMVESRADAFANKHSTEEEKEAAIAFLIDVREAASKTNIVAQLLRRPFHPSETSRIAAIRASIQKAS